ncbi:hypothetical protein EMIHUDRAFT_206498 [Emiliania huxleyi CCMP1516]|uniref:AP2/ERF domain-containing protein n=2 Tax=Emiliania huxleyi TaxID=2903 RepID=A0A0D3JLZ1_EMIH1|nr:hypothetical protein EMIHUDRAFT_206498 [Emiliania huxleyi CCMP1516]EOD24526.1 hypothetical protein EMIHUDRAFT_206498 [Emiliania huxleyi CCMP1516]|eukprot:XP_005776955.1 hypothetical protein EMIHUDRAFT_206498 [Emiliania huxleyi CCMP1516]
MTGRVLVKSSRRGSKKYELRAWVGGKQGSLGYFATAEQAALFYARREAGRDTSDLTAPPPPPVPSSPAGAEAIRQAEREALTLVTSSNNSTGYKGVSFCPKREGSKKYLLSVKVGGKQAGREGLTLVTSGSSNSGYKGVLFYPKQRHTKQYKLQVTTGGKKVTLGYFATAEEAALARARHLWDTTVRLLEPQPQQAPPQGAAGPSEATTRRRPHYRARSSLVRRSYIFLVCGCVPFGCPGAVLAVIIRTF